MKIRTRLRIGYGGFVLALALLGGWSARTMSQMSDVSGHIISENYDSVIAAQGMKESLERQDSAAVFELLGEHDRARRQAADHRARFDAALASAAANITEPGEADVIAAIRRDRDDYYQRFDAFLAAPGPRTQQYFEQLEPRFDDVRAQCDRLLRLNQEAMRSKAAAAAATARRWFTLTLGLSLLLMAAGVVVEIRLSRAILDPVLQLTGAMTRVAGGELDTSVPVRGADEIGVLAEGFNRMAGRIRELRRSDLGRLIVAQKASEAAMEALREPLDRVEEEFFSAAALRLRGPLTNVRSAIHLLLEGAAGELSDSQQALLAASSTDAQQLDDLMRELTAAALERGEGGPRRDVRMSALVRDVTEAVRLELEHGGVQMRVDVPPDLPAVHVDREALAQALQNLVLHAAQPVAAGGLVSVTGEKRGGGVALTVGRPDVVIPPEELVHVFEAFAVLRGRASHDAGLGLIVARRIVEAEGGTVTAQSEPGTGTTFVVTLPVPEGVRTDVG